MTDYLFISSTPANESCAQVGQYDYAIRARAECTAFIHQLRRQFGKEPIGAHLRIKSNPHDFGTYYEVVCDYDTHEPQSAEYAYRIERESPATWDAEAKRELRAQRYTFPTPEYDV